ncbi:MAG TPA: zinc ribbon domain-containing protein [Blastocatellia bacterium]|nr:zinc ribbon domain-containing protein [Blastocatellia bacterium]
MTPAYCHECGRANAATARRCLWCGLPLVDQGTPKHFEATRAELDYLDGIERLDDPLPVRLLIDSSGIEVREQMPGSRTARINAATILDAATVDASLTRQAEPPRTPLWRYLILPFGITWFFKKKPAAAEQKQHDYVLLIRYRAGGETRTAVFHRQDRAGLAVIEGLARIINMLVRFTNERRG